MTQSDTLTQTPVTTVIFDLGDVLFQWSPAAAIQEFSPKIFHAMLTSETWNRFEEGKLDESQTFDKLSVDHGIDVDELRKVFKMIRETLKPVPEMWGFLKELKTQGLTLYGMSNISEPDWALTESLVDPEAWKIFDRVFTS